MQHGSCSGLWFELHSEPRGKSSPWSEILTCNPLCRRNLYFYQETFLLSYSNLSVASMTVVPPSVGLSSLAKPSLSCADLHLSTWYWLELVLFGANHLLPSILGNWKLRNNVFSNPNLVHLWRLICRCSPILRPLFSQSTCASTEPTC